MLVGMMWVRNCHHSWWAPASMSLGRGVRRLDRAGVGVDAVAEAEDVDGDQAEEQGKDRADLEIRQGLQPVMPTFFRSATLAMPPTMVRNTIGPISIFMALTKVVPIGSMAMPAAGAEPADQNAEDDAGQYPEVQLPVPAFLGGRACRVRRGGDVSHDSYLIVECPGDA